MVGSVALPDLESSVGHSFGLELDGVQVGALSDVTLTMEQDVVELKESGPDGKVVVRSLPGRAKSPEITLTRRVTADNTFRLWVKQVQAGTDGVRKNGSVRVVDQAGALVTTYRFTNAWPKSVEISTLQAGGASSVAERLLLVCEHLEPE
jgi:phage tail-like protein